DRSSSEWFERRRARSLIEMNCECAPCLMSHLDDVDVGLPGCIGWRTPRVNHCVACLTVSLTATHHAPKREPLALPLPHCGNALAACTSSLLRFVLSLTFICLSTLFAAIAPHQTYHSHFTSRPVQCNASSPHSNYVFITSAW